MVALAALVPAVAGCAGQEGIGDPPRVAPGFLQQHESLPTDVLGTWYLNRGGQRVTLVLNDQGGEPGGSVSAEGGKDDFPLEAFQFSTPQGQPTTLAFRALEDRTITWYRLQVEDGVVTGRVARTANYVLPDISAFQGQLTGWRAETFNADIVPRTFDIAIDGQWQAILRVDAAAGAFAGQLKLYADGNGALSEQLLEDVTVTAWDGSTLSFVRSVAAGSEQYTGKVAGRLITGTVHSASRSAPTAWHGQRAEIFSHGVGARSSQALIDWQAHTRSRLMRLMMDGAPAPLTSSTAVLSTRAPVPQLAVPATRDDAFASWPQSYQLDEVQWQYTLPNAYGADPLTRVAHGYVAVPTTAPPVGGFPLAVALNGHGGSALADFDPNNPSYWYGDAFARRGYVVVAVDIGHRPLGDRSSLYGDELAGDDPNNGNGNHPAIAAAGFASDWEEDGERAWDALRALDYVLSRTDVDPTRITVVGLSMGGEVADLVGAIDLRVQATLAAGDPPDLAVMQLHGNHPCFDWLRGNVREYFDPSDLHALVAPRTLIRETGAVDTVYSNSTWPYASAKQVIRRAQPAFDALGGTLLHYLHDGAHLFCVGDTTSGAATAAGVTAPMETAPSASEASPTAWESDPTTMALSATSLFDLLPR
ncbi:MAG TPA: dienelactone hydrolase family protein [Polyangia bacterium]|nr:dienelactone hydrolase family protein [Polyangia bacterium]